jgi:hypothetical protein
VWILEEEPIDRGAEREEYKRRAGQVLPNLVIGQLADSFTGFMRTPSPEKSSPFTTVYRVLPVESRSMRRIFLEPLDLQYRSLPPELIDAFSHDLAVVTGATRQAVEDIHPNIIRQRSTVREFLQQACDVEVAPPPSVLDSPLRSLQQWLDALEQRRSVISQEVQEVGEILTRVKQIHGSVKAEHNSAMVHTSSVYPEVRHELLSLSWRQY